MTEDEISEYDNESIAEAIVEMLSHKAVSREALIAAYNILNAGVTLDT